MGNARRRSLCRMLGTVPLVGGVILASASPAAAAKPSTQPFSFTVSDSIDCGSFSDEFTDVFTGRETVFFDASGQPVKVIQHIKHSSVDRNSVTGAFFEEHGSFTVTVDLVAETVTSTGPQEVATVPGKGVVILDTGRAVFDFQDNLLFFAGPKQYSNLFHSEQELYCPALS